MSDTVKGTIEWIHSEVGRFSEQIVEEKKAEIAMVSDLDFSEKVAKITNAESNQYTVATQIARMNDAIILLAHGIKRETVLDILENQIEGITIRMIGG